MNCSIMNEYMKWLIEYVYFAYYYAFINWFICGCLLLLNRTCVLAELLIITNDRKVPGFITNIWSLPVGILEQNAALCLLLITDKNVCSINNPIANTSHLSYISLFFFFFLFFTLERVLFSEIIEKRACLQTKEAVLVMLSAHPKALAH